MNKKELQHLYVSKIIMPYGRHWGSTYNIDSLHFECCYYQGIEYCINNHLQIFDPGVQGEHKIRRGFEPKLTSSFHYLKEADFRMQLKTSAQEKVLRLKIISRLVRDIHRLRKNIKFRYVKNIT